MMFFMSMDLFTAHGACSFVGSDIKGNTIVPESKISNSYEDQSLYFFEKYSKDLLIEVRSVSGNSTSSQAFLIMFVSVFLCGTSKYT